MNEIDPKESLSFLEVFKAFSAFISTVLIALASVYATTQYNNRQLEITKIREISALIPKLGSENGNERKFSAIALGLYGDAAIPPLMALLDDPDQEVRLAGSKSLAIIGNVAVPSLESAFSNKKNSANLRATSLWTLGSMKTQSGLLLAKKALADPREDPFVRKDAATALGYLKDSSSTELLLGTLRQSKDKDLTTNIIWSLGEIASPLSSKSLIPFLSNSNEDLRIQAVWALSKINDSNVEIESALSLVAASDSSNKVKSAAKEALEWHKRLE